MYQEARHSEKVVTYPQLREAEEGLRRMLFAKRFSREWIERQMPEVMGQARTDLAVRLAAEEVKDPVALLVVIAYRRALKVVRSEATKPRESSLEEVLHPVDENARTPEQEVMEGERQRRLLDAMNHLSEKERRLLALHYFGEMTVKDAGRQVGWSPSSAVRHQRLALEKLRSLVGERALLGTEIAAPAMVTSGYVSPKGLLEAWADTAMNLVRELASAGAQRYAPVAESGNALAMSGAGRTTAGVCGLAVAACLSAVTSGVVGPGVGAGLDSPQRQADQKPRLERVKAAEPPSTPAAAPPPLAASGGGASETPTTTSAPRTIRNRHMPRKQAARARADADRNVLAAPQVPVATSTRPGQETVSEFGLRSDQPEQAAQEPEAEPAEGAPISSPPPPRASAPPPAAPSTSTGPGAAEFGM